MQNRIPSFVKLPRYKRFDYKPQFYDAEKEELEQRVAQIKKEVEAEKNGTVHPEALRGKLKADWHRESRSSITGKSNMRVFIIALLLFIVVYFYLKY